VKNIILQEVGEWLNFGRKLNLFTFLKYPIVAFAETLATPADWFCCPIKNKYSGAEFLSAMGKIN